MASRPAQAGNDHLSLRLVKHLAVPQSSFPPIDGRSIPSTMQVEADVPAPPPGFGVIVVRIKSMSNRWGIGAGFVRKPAPPVGDALGDEPFFSVASASRGWIFAKPEGNWFALTVPAGRWQLSNSGFVVYCLGAPSFEVGEGEAVFAGTIDLGGDNLGPDLEMAPARAWLKGPLAEGLRPAEYRNGATSSCNVFSTIYALEIPGAPFEDGYRNGSRAEP